MSKPNSGKRISLNKRMGTNLPYRVNKTDAMNRFLGRIKNIELLTPSQERKLFKIVHHGTEEQRNLAKTRIIEANQKFVYALAKCYTNDDELIMDLISEGNMGLLQAIDTFNPSKDVKFLTYAVHYIRRGIVDFLTNNGTMIQKPNAIRTYHIVPKIKSKFMAKEQRQPTEDEIAEILYTDYGIKISDNSDLYELKIDSMDSMKEDDRSDKNNQYESLGMRAVSYNEVNSAIDNEANSALVSALIERLKPREQKIIKMYFGIGYPYEYSIQAIAQELDFTPERVRQIVGEALKKMRALSLNYRII